MIRIVTSFAVLATALAIALPAHAQNGSLTRSFVSSAGSDTNPCTVAQPCASFARAYTMVGPNGIVAALDPGKYGPLIITGGVTINGNGWAAITGPAQSNAITVNAGSGNVTLIGIEVDGAGAAYNGIVLNSAGSLTVTNCTVQNFLSDGLENTGNGILMQPPSSTLNFTITNTTASNNGAGGIVYLPQFGSSPNASGVIDHVVANANAVGIWINLSSAASGGTVVAVSNSIASDNSSTGIIVENGALSSTLKASIDTVNLSGNAIDGISAGRDAKVLLGHSVITANGTGVSNGTTPNTFFTYKNNEINQNGTDFDPNGAALTSTPLQ